MNAADLIRRIVNKPIEPIFHSDYEIEGILLAVRAYNPAAELALREHLKALENMALVLYDSVGHAIRYEYESPGTSQALKDIQKLSWKRRKK